MTLSRNRKTRAAGDGHRSRLRGRRAVCLIQLFCLAFAAAGADAADAQRRKVWVYLNDKGPVQSDRLQKRVNENLTPRAVARRHLRGDPGRAATVADLPVYGDYIREIRDLGVTILRQSKWLNAVSILADSGDIEALERKPFVSKIEPVRVFQRAAPREDMALAKAGAGGSTTDLDYGAATNQIEICNVPPLHAAGLTGEGVLIAMLDTGYFYEQHRAFQNLQVVAEHDFINNDGVTKNEPGETLSQQNHGSWVLSIIAGYAPGEIVGPAYGAQYALAKTENVASETRVEEDNWVAAVEWADSLGADVISSSLGYLNFDDGFTYTLEDLDGSSMVTSIAASMAVERGIVVVTSAGNEGNDKNWPYILSPADGLGVIAVGGVNSQGDRVSFSSIGPTSDGRIKPDIMAMGAGCTVANFTSDTGVSFLNGTSLAAPVVAGVCALLLQAYPGMTPQLLWEVLTATASNAAAPDNLSGYGIVNALAAFNEARTTFVASGEVPEAFALLGQRINTADGFTRMLLDVPAAEVFEVTLYNLKGQQIDRFRRFVGAGRGMELIWSWPASAASGRYWARISSPRVERVLKTMIVR
jgi:serine protease AprX